MCVCDDSGSWEKAPTFLKDWAQERIKHVLHLLIQCHSSIFQLSQPILCSQVAVSPVGRIAAGGKTAGWPGQPQRGERGGPHLVTTATRPSCTSALTVLSPLLLSPVEISSRKERKRPIYPVPHCILCIKFCPEAFRKSSVSEISPLKERKGLIYPVPYCILCIKLCPPHSKSSINVGYLNESNFYHFFIGLFFRFFSPLPWILNIHWFALIFVTIPAYI